MVLTILAGLIVIVTATVFLFGKNDRRTSTTSENDSHLASTTSPTVTTGKPTLSPLPTVQVTYTDTGFVPGTITVKAGQSVVFTNQSSGMMWVASDPHPTHTLYPTFDEKSAVPRGASFTFTFTRAGTWRYHNHYYPVAKGTVIVQ